MISKLVNAIVESVSQLTPTMLQYVLKPEKYVDYLAGQYLQVIVDGDNYSYSIANAPLGNKCYELHIKHSNNSHMLMVMRKGSKIKLNIPLGNCYLERMHSTKPIIFIAIGSGFPPIKAILEKLIFDADGRNKKLYWSVRSQEELYLQDEIQSWQNHDKNFNYYLHISQDEDISKTSVSKGLLIKKILEENNKTLQNYQIVMCGPFDYIYEMRDILLCNGVAREDMYSDAFSFEN